MNIVILGCGRVGAKLASMMDSEGHKVSVIDKNRDAFRRLEPGFKGVKVGGLGIDEDILKKAGISSADVFVAVTNGDNSNVMSSQIAKEIYKVPMVLTRIVDPMREKAFREFGLQTYCRTSMDAAILHNTILGKEMNIDKLNELLNESTNININE